MTITAEQLAAAIKRANEEVHGLDYACIYDEHLRHFGIDGPVDLERVAEILNEKPRQP